MSIEEIKQTLNVHTAILKHHSAILESLENSGKLQDGQDIFSDSLPLRTGRDVDNIEAELADEDKKKALARMNVVFKSKHFKQ